MRRLGRRIAIAVVALALLWLSGVAAVAFWNERPMLIAVLTVQLASVGLLLLVLWSSQRRLSQEIRNHTSRELGALCEELGRASGELRNATEEMRNHLGDLIRAELDRHDVRLVRHQDAARARLERQIAQARGGVHGDGVRDAGEPDR